MGAIEILNILKSNKIGMTAAEISELSECSSNSVQKCLKRLVKDVSENIEQKLLTPEEKEEKYGRIVGCRIFIYKFNE